LNMSNDGVLSVSEVTSDIKMLLENTYQRVVVKGEVSNLRCPMSGHAYFTLKDANAQLSAVLFKGSRRFQKVDLVDGQEVQCKGRMSVYMPRGTYQLIVSQVDRVGQGDLHQKYEELKEKLAKAGYFDADRKRPIPALPTSIAVITSASGAAIQDFIRVATRRYQGVRITIVPVLVQGEGSVPSIVDAFSLIQRHLEKFDVVVVTRGGGSIEDLWSFNDEAVCKAVFDCRIPVVSAVGHETDFTLSDFTADLRAATPSAAAEMVIPDGASVSRHVSSISRRLQLAVNRDLDKARFQLSRAKMRLKDPQRVLDDARLKLDDRRRLIADIVKSTLQSHRHRLEIASEKLQAIGPESVLQRGYSIVKGGSGKIATSVENVAPGDEIKIMFSDGTANAKIKSTEMKGPFI
jgi:exodeoxyribonuclease VII large subunit